MMGCSNLIVGLKGRTVSKLLESITRAVCPYVHKKQWQPSNKAT